MRLESPTQGRQETKVLSRTIFHFTQKKLNQIQVGLQLDPCQVIYSLKKQRKKKWLDILRLTHLDYPEEDNFFKTVQLEMMPKIREFNASASHLPTMKLLDVKAQ